MPKDQAAANENETVSLNENKDLAEENSALRSQIDALYIDIERVRQECEKYKRWWLDEAQEKKDLKKIIFAVVRSKNMSAEELLKTMFNV